MFKIEDCDSNVNCKSALDVSRVHWDGIKLDQQACDFFCITQFAPTQDSALEKFNDAAACLLPCAIPEEFTPCKSSCLKEELACFAGSLFSLVHALTLFADGTCREGLVNNELDSSLALAKPVNDCKTPTINCPSSLTVPPDVGRRRTKLTLVRSPIRLRL